MGGFIFLGAYDQARSLLLEVGRKSPRSRHYMSLQSFLCLGLQCGSLKMAAESSLMKAKAQAAPGNFSW